MRFAPTDFEKVVTFCFEVEFRCVLPLTDFKVLLFVFVYVGRIINSKLIFRKLISGGRGLSEGGVGVKNMTEGIYCEFF